MAARSDAATDRVSYTASAPPDTATAFTAAFWAYLSTDQSANETLFRLHASSGSTTRLTVATNSGGTTPNLFTPGNTGGVSCGTALGTGAWCRIACTCSGTSGTAYGASGAAGATTSGTGTVSGGSTPDGITLYGRSASDSTEWFSGRIAFFRIWAAVLTQAEIEKEWMSPVHVRTTNLWSDWPLLGGTPGVGGAIDLSDISGNGRNLVAGSTALSPEDDAPILDNGAFFGHLMAA